MKNLFLNRKNAHIGFVRFLCGVLGSLVIAYALMMLLAQAFSFSVFENLVLAMSALPLLWAGVGLWIFLSTTPLHALIKTVLTLLVLLPCLWFLGA